MKCIIGKMAQDKIVECIGGISCSHLGGYLRTEMRVGESVTVRQCRALGGVCLRLSRVDYSNVTQPSKCICAGGSV